VAAIARNIFLGFDVAFVAGGRRELAWVIPARFPALREAVDAFLARAKRDGTLDRLADRYFGHSAQVRRIDAGVFHDRIGTLLPGYRLLFQHAQAATGMEWRLLAAIAYQESQWDSLATSETGVRGMMQLTEETARHLGVRDRLDARQSILAAARYLTDLKRALPARIQEPDRTWLALAAFNIGMGHLEDARVLARKQKLDPDLWSNVKQTLPLLASPEFYQQAKLGYARGGMPVVFVDRVRAYYDILLAREAAYIPRLHVGNVSADPERATGIAAFGGP
jgi:membrane-bound lytic murein transglycosylase F